LDDAHCASLVRVRVTVGVGVGVGVRVRVWVRVRVRVRVSLKGPSLPSATSIPETVTFTPWPSGALTVTSW